MRVCSGSGRSVAAAGSASRFSAIGRLVTKGRPSYVAPAPLQRSSYHQSFLGHASQGLSKSDGPRLWPEGWQQLHCERKARAYSQASKM